MITSGSSLEVMVAREELLSLVSTRVMEEQRLEIEAEPTREEVRKTPKKLPKSKVPRRDKMTVEVLLACWISFKMSCLNMIILF